MDGTILTSKDVQMILAGLWSLDDKRSETAENDIPDIINRFRNLEKEADRARTEQSFFVPKEEIVENGYDLSINNKDLLVCDC